MWQNTVLEYSFTRECRVVFGSGRHTSWREKPLLNFLVNPLCDFQLLYGSPIGLDQSLETGLLWVEFMLSKACTLFKNFKYSLENF